MMQSRTRTKGFVKGISREVEARLKTTDRGKVAVDAVRLMRGDVMQLALASGDLPRIAAMAIGPIVVGAATVDQLFARRLTANDVERLDQLFDLLDRQGNQRIRTATSDLRRLFADGEDRTIADLV